MNTSKQIELINNALTFEKADTVFLCDVSGSMTESIKGRTKLQMMQDTLLGVLPQIGGAKVILFDGQLYEANSWQDIIAPRYGAGTHLAKALRRARRSNPSRVLIITDGEPTDGQDNCFDVARSMLARIDVFYCGKGEGSAVEFCRDLCQYGGECKVDPSGLSMLESVTLMLGAGDISL